MNNTTAMKRIATIAFMLVLTGVGLCQEVIRFPYAGYMEYPMDTLHSTHTNEITRQPCAYRVYQMQLPQPFARLFTVDTPTTLYGIAVPLWGQDTARRDFEVVLYTLHGNHVTPIWEQRWSDTIPFRHLVFETQFEPGFPHCTKEDHHIDTANSYEFYFDTPIVVSDSFLVGYYTYGNDGQRHINGHGVDPALTGYIYQVIFSTRCHVRDEEDVPPLGSWITVTNTISYLQSYAWAMLMPIIEAPPCNPDTLACPAPQGFSARVIDSLNVEFVWNPLPQHLSFQISVGREGEPPDSAHVFSSDTCLLRVTDNWDTTASYAAYIRAQCLQHCYAGDTLIWGSWSGPVSFSVPSAHQPHQPTDITMPVGQPCPFTLTPNPARGLVTVRLADCSPHTTLTIRDATGHDILTIPVSAATFTIPIHNYAAGTYFVTLSTPHATTTERLIIE